MSSAAPRQTSCGHTGRVRPVRVLPGRVLPRRIAKAGRVARRIVRRTPETNPIDRPGTLEAQWRAWPELAQFPPLDVTNWASAVVLAAHPDDEVLGAGGIICQLAAAGARLRVIAVTDGEAAYPRYGGTDLVARRVRERTAALAALGSDGAEVLRLRLPDAGLAGRDRDIAERIAELVAGFDVCLAPWEKDVHADHEAVGRAAAQVSGCAFFYPVWMWHWAAPADPRVPWHEMVRVPLSAEVAARKEAAIRCFDSQLTSADPGAGPVLSADFVTHFTRGYELLLPASRP